jgi:hypothetical protein
MILRSAGTVLPVVGLAMRGRAAKVFSERPRLAGQGRRGGRSSHRISFLGHAPHCREALTRASKPSGAIARREVAGQRATRIDRPASPTV